MHLFDSRGFANFHAADVTMEVEYHARLVVLPVAAFDLRPRH